MSYEWYRTAPTILTATPLSEFDEQLQRPPYCRETESCLRVTTTTADMIARVKIGQLIPKSITEADALSQSESPVHRVGDEQFGLLVCYYVGRLGDVSSGSETHIYREAV